MTRLDSNEFKDITVFQEQSQRFYEICAGCRRCFNLCPSFDVLFRAIDDKDGEVSMVETQSLNQVVDLCYYCKLCFNHCPYCPPHDYNLDFPRLMLQGKYLKAQQERPSLRDRLLVNVDTLGYLGGLIAPIANWIFKQKFFRWLIEAVLGIHRKRLFPKFHRQAFASWFHQPTASAPQPSPTEKVALFYTCYVNRHDPDIGKATIQVLNKNGVEVICPEQQCCGMPYFDIGDIDTVREKAKQNLKALKAAVDAGYKIISPVPTCSLMIKKEYPDLINTDDAREVAANTYDLCEYLMKLEAQGKLSKDFVSSPGKIAYQVACHLRDQNIGLQSRDLMRLIPGTTVQVIERCSGHDGTFGIKQEYYDLSLQVGHKAFSATEEAEADVIVSDCPLSGIALTEATGKQSFHPIQIIRKAYGITP